MAEWVVTAALLVGSATLNTGGVVLLRFAVGSGNVIAGVLGCLCWAATSAVFLALLAQKHELAVVSVLTSALGFLAVIAVGAWFGETLTARQVLAIAILIVGMTLLSMPKAG